MIEIQEKQSQQPKARGVTLISLIVTIIVLLILAGVTLGALTGDSRNNNKSRRSSIQK